MEKTMHTGIGFLDRYRERMAREAGMRKSRAGGDPRFAYFRRKVLEHLEALEGKENVGKALLAAGDLLKGGFPVGTIRVWKEKRYIKIAPGKWRPKYDSQTRGANLSVAAIKRKAASCKTSQELLQLVLEHKSRFSDKNGYPLPFVKELSDYVSGLNDRLEAGSGKPEKKTEATAPKKTGNKAAAEKPGKLAGLSGKMSLVTPSGGKREMPEKGYTAKLRSDLKEKLRPQFGLHKNKKTGIEASLSGDSVNKMGSEKAIEKSKANGFTVEDHFEVAKNIVELYENADLVEIGPDKRGSPDLKSIKRFDCETTLSSGKKTVAHITVKESVQNGHKIYSVEILDLEQKNTAGEKPTVGGGISEETPTSASTLPQPGGSVKESEEEKHRNRSEAMKGNQNARKHGQTDAEMKAEQKKTKEARKKAGLPEPGKNTGERVSAMEDSLSYNPNAANYAYKDTGYIAGSQKEKIAEFWKRKNALGEGVGAEEIDWNTLEENERYAAQMITKKNIMGRIDYDGWKTKGMTPTAAFLASRLLAAVGTEPAEQTEQGRKNYVIAIDTLKSRLNECVSCTDVFDLAEDIYHEAKQTYISQIRRNPEVEKLSKQLDELSGQARALNTALQKFIADNINSKWRTQRELNAHMAEIERMVQEEADRLEPGIKHRIGISTETFSRGEYIFARTNFLEAEQTELGNRIREKTREVWDKLAAEDSTHEVWKQLGSKFTEIVKSDSFNKHFQSLRIYDEDKKFATNSRTGEKTESYWYKYRNKEYDKYTTWDWAGAGKTEHRKDSEIIRGRVKRRFEMIVPKTLERKGGRNITVRSTAELKAMFNFRDIQTGTYVQTDPASAKWHVENIASGFADLCDVTGIPDNLISLNGRLALAVGARGHGKALAHYEPVQRVINITKMKGGGSLGHEWFHAFDNLIAEAMNGGNYNQWLTNPDYRRKDKELGSDDANTKVKAAFAGLMDAIMKGGTPETMTVSYKKEDFEAGKRLFGTSYYNEFYNNLAKSKTLKEAVKVINGKYRPSVNLILEGGLLEKKGVSPYEKQRARKILKNYNNLLKKAAAYFGNEEEGSAVVETGNTVSRFYEDAKKLDGGRSNPYWSTPHEMAARAFEAYLCDKLKESGRKNDYLSGHADNTEYGGEFNPYPAEREREKINGAFGKLFKAVAETKAIRKSLEMLSGGKLLKAGYPVGTIRVWKGKRYIKIAPGKWKLQSAGGTRGSGGKKQPWKFSSLSNREKAELGRKISRTIVSGIGKETVAYSGKGDFDKAAKDWIRANPQKDADTLIGGIAIDAKSVARDMHHGEDEDKYLKLQTLPAVKDVLEKGTYLGYEPDFDGKPIDNHYFAGKIKYGDEEKIVFCRVRENAGRSSRFYVHEVFTEDEIKKEASMRGTSPSSGRLTGKPLYEFILRDVLTVKKQKNTAGEKPTVGGGVHEEAPTSASTLSQSGKSVKKSWWCWFDGDGRFWIRKSALEAFVREGNGK